MSEAKQNSGLEEPSQNAGRNGLTRRDFLSEITLGALGIGGLGSAALTYQFFSPNVLFEPATTFRAGNPDLYPLNSVTFLQDQQVYIVRTAGGFYAVSAVCTHLGCVTQWKPEADLIACPCHGSKFRTDGSKIEGPAPRPLAWLRMTLSDEGDLMVDRSTTVAAGQYLMT